MCLLLCVSVDEKENKRQRTLVAPRVPRGRTLEHNAFAVVVPKLTGVVAIAYFAFELPVCLLVYAYRGYRYSS